MCVLLNQPHAGVKPGQWAVLYCAAFSHGAAGGKATYLNLLTTDILKLTTISSLVHFSNSPYFPWTSWQEWSFSSVSQTPSCECLGKTWGHWWSAVRQTEKWGCETFAGLLQDRIITLLTQIIEKSQGLDTLMMTKSDFVSSSECSKMWSEWEKVDID